MERKEAIIRIKEIEKRSLDQHNIYTPLELCDKMIEKISGLNKDQTIMVMFNLEFLWVLREKFGKDEMSNVWFLTPCEFKKKAAVAMGVQQNHVNIYEYNTKEIKGEKMPKFDVVVGNPPFQEKSKATGKSSRSPKRLWVNFIEISLNIVKENGYVSLIVPSGWIGSTSPIRKTLNNYNIIYANISEQVKNMFGVGGSMNFTYFLLKKESKQRPPIIEFDNNIKERIDLLEMQINPVKSSNYNDFSIIKKILDSNISPLSWKRRDSYTETDYYEAILPRVKTSINSYVSSNGSEDGILAHKTDKTTAENIAHNLNRKLYKRMTWVIRSGMAISSNINYLPIPSDKKYTDNEIYNLFNLSRDEINWVESHEKGER